MDIVGIQALSEYYASVDAGGSQHLHNFYTARQRNTLLKQTVSFVMETNFTLRRKKNIFISLCQTKNLAMYNYHWIILQEPVDDQ